MTTGSADKDRGFEEESSSRFFIHEPKEFVFATESLAFRASNIRLRICNREARK
jgi:hypothetical protein